MARSLPLDKHTLVTSLRGMFNEVVAVTGDGTNDAPALHEADIGLATGIAGTEVLFVPPCVYICSFEQLSLHYVCNSSQVAKENADVIIMDDNFSTIINVAKWGCFVYINIQKFVQFQLTVNIVALMVNVLHLCIFHRCPLIMYVWCHRVAICCIVLATEHLPAGRARRSPLQREDPVAVGRRSM
jgi:P-type Ca2+ transporter type 2C